MGSSLVLVHFIGQMAGFIKEIGKKDACTATENCRLSSCRRCMMVILRKISSQDPQSCQNFWQLKRKKLSFQIINQQVLGPTAQTGVVKIIVVVAAGMRETQINLATILTSYDDKFKDFT